MSDSIKSKLQNPRSDSHPSTNPAGAPACRWQLLSRTSRGVSRTLALQSLRLAILMLAIGLVALALFASPDGTQGKNPTLVTVATGTRQDGKGNPILPMAGCTGASFNQPAGSPLSVGVGPRAMVAADFNRDGKPDIAVMGETSSDLTIFLGDGAGAFSKTPASPIALGGSSANMAIADFNLDGKADLVVSYAASSNMGILLGDGAGGFALSTFTVPAGSFVGDLVTADFNLDGKPDFAVSNFNLSNVSVVLGNGNGGFSAAPGSPAAAGTNPAGLASADFNRDGKPDIAVVNVSSNNVNILLGNGNGSFSQAAQSPVATQGSFPFKVLARDLNADGKVDLVTVNNSSNNLSIMLGNGDGTFQTPTLLALPSSPTAASLADVNLDGNLDLIVSVGISNVVRIFLGNGQGAFTQASGSPISTGNVAQWSAVADFNLDGRPDFAVANSGSNTVTVELNSCNAQPCGGIGFTPAVGSPVAAQDRAATAADFNLDGKPDLAVAQSNGPGGLSILIGNGNGSFSPAPGSPLTTGFGAATLASGDFNLDGKPDLAIPKTGASGFSILIGNGNGTFGAPQGAGGGLLFPGTVVVADLNRDGKPDLVSSLAVSGVAVLLGNGTGGFSAGSTFAAGSGSSGVTVADFNRDGKLDAAVANSGSNDVTILLGDGAGNLVPASGSPVGVGNTPDSLVSGDFDFDGKVDLAVTNAGSKNVTILIGNGNGGFAPAAGSPIAAGNNPGPMVVADLNLDGKLDLAVANPGTSKATVILLGNGSGGFAPAAGSPLTGANNSTSLAISDFNLDGKMDLAVVNNDIASVTINLNSCAAPAPTPTPTPTPTPNLVLFSPANIPVTEACTAVTINVNRSGDTSTAATVDYATSDGTASERSDYITARGTLTFAPGDTSKTFTVLINDDSFVEGSENFSINLSNPVGFSLGTPATAVVNILDNQSEPATNPIDDAQTFVCQHYHDFLNRQPDQSGWDFWTNQINSCGSDQNCLDAKRVNVSAAFFLSIEFQNTGFFVERMYKAAFGDATGTSTVGGAHQLAVPIIQYNEFIADAQRIARGVVVLQSGWQQVLELNTQSFCAAFVARPSFTSAFPASMTGAQFVDKLNTNAGNPLSPAERDQLVNELSTNVKTRAQVIRAVAEDTDFVNSEFSRAFVLAEYFGYLRRNPNAPQDTDHSGYDFWLTKLNQFNGNYINAQMTWAFLSSAEYRHRFGP